MGVGNTDRILGDTGGNPNLLWSGRDRLTVIDHNLAFSYENMPPTLHEFSSHHVFGEELLTQEALSLNGDGLDPSPLIRAWIELERFWGSSAGMLDASWEGVPETWLEGASGFTLEKIRTCLARVEDENFWELRGEADK